MQGVVDAGLVVGLVRARCRVRRAACTACLNGEVDDGRGAADGCGVGAGEEVVGGDGAAEGHVEVRVRRRCRRA